MKRILLLIIVAFVFTWMIPSGCAVIVPPTGGPKDSIPPVFLGAEPKDSSLNFNAKEIDINFNEYIQLDNPSQSVIVSPITKHTPTITALLRQIKVRIKDTLDANTTYSINFGRSIKDVNEGNVYKRYTYVFSTGDHIDTDSISGTVRLAQTGGTDTSMIVVLYTNFSDTAIYKTQPRYYTTILDSNGRFVFHFLPKQKFNLFAVKNTYMKDYADSTDQFAFSDSTVNTENDSACQNLKLFAFQAFPKVQKKTGTTAVSGKQKQKEKEKEAKKPLQVNVDIDKGKQTLLKPLEITYNKPLKSFDSSIILLTDTNYNKIQNYKVIRDSADTTNTKFMVVTNWLEDSDYKLIIPKEAAKDSFDVALAKADTVSFQTRNSEDYAQVELDFPDVDTLQHPVLQIFSSDKMLDSMRIPSNRKIMIPQFEPGKYNFRILYDRNNDMKWTPGDYKKRRQPEIVVAIKKTFEFIADTENQWDIYMVTKEQPHYNPLNL